MRLPTVKLMARGPKNNGFVYNPHVTVFYETLALCLKVTITDYRILAGYDLGLFPS